MTSISLARLFINHEVCQCLWGGHADYSYFGTYSRLCASAASACNWAGYHTFNVMVFKCTHLTTLITLNVLQTGCTVVTQLRFEPGSLVWRAGSLTIKPSGPAYSLLRCGAHQWNKLLETCCMMQQISIFHWNSAHYETRNILYFLKYISWNLLNCVVRRNVAQIQTLLSCFLSIQMGR